jgi:hypothetical protein
MGWRPDVSLITELQRAATSDTRGTLERVEHRLTTGKPPRPSDRARLLAVRAFAWTLLGQWSAADAALDEADAIPRTGHVARCDLVHFRAELRLEQAMSEPSADAWRVAVEVAEEAVRVCTQPPPDRGVPANRRYWSDRRHRGTAATTAYVYVIRGQVRLKHHGDVGAALRDGRRAHEVAPYYRGKPSRAHLAAVSLLTTCAIENLATPAVELAAARQTIREISAHLPRDATIPQAQMDAAEACIVARLGDPDDGERRLRAALDRLRAAGARSTYLQLVKVVGWLIRDPGKDPERARFTVRQLHLEAPA